METRSGTGARIARTLVVLALAAVSSWSLIGSAAATAASDVTITKVSDAPGPLRVGDAFAYTLTVENTGTATAHGIEVQDDLPLGVHVTTLVPSFPGGHCTVASSVGTGHSEHWSVTCVRGSLAAGQSVAVTFGVNLAADVHCGSLTNTASVSAYDEPAAAQGDDEASVTDTVTCPPSVEITKTAPRFAHVGTKLPLTMHVTNPGTAPLDHVAVTDPGCDTALHGNGDGTLSPGERWTYHCDHIVRPDAEDWFITTATVRATSTSGAAHASARAATRVLRPELTVSVTPTPVSGTPGDTIAYRYVARNTGNATLTSLTIVDDQLGAVGTVATLAPGHSASFTVDRILAARHPWVINTATATGEDPSGHAVTASDHASVTIVAGTGRTDGTSGDGTAFTGSDATLPAVAALLLAIAGIAALLLADRRRG